MDVRLNNTFGRQARNSAETRAALLATARRVAARVAAATPRDTGETAASTRVEAARSLDGKSAAARIVQGGAGVQQQFGNSRERTPARQFDRARGR